MIVKSLRNNVSQGISVNQLYPVLEYEKNTHSGQMRYRIYEDGGTMSWTIDKYFSIESDILDGYIQKKMLTKKSTAIRGLIKSLISNLILKTRIRYMPHKNWK